VSDIYDQEALDAMVGEVMGQVDGLATASLVLVNHKTGESATETMTIEDILEPNDTTTIMVGREYGTNKVVKVEVSYPKTTEEETKSE
jgi:hypothetical protein